MSKAKWYFFLFLYMTLINYVSRDIGLVSVEYSIQDFQTVEDIGFFEGIVLLVRILLDNIETFLQFITLQAELPVMLSVFFISPLVFMGVVLLILTIRGG